MVDITLIVASILSAITVGAAIEYYRYLRKAQREYEKAKVAVEDIVLSFKREIKREAERLEAVAYKVEAVSSKSEHALRSAAEVEKQMNNLEPKVVAVLGEREKTLARLDEIDKATRDAVVSQEKLTAKVSSLEEQTQQFSARAEVGVEAVIPIKREKALAPLTETELAALEMLAAEGPKTAPEIKEKIKLSREHTARLMKKLYEEGYLERDSKKIPFKYSVKKEMAKLLKKEEHEARQSS